MARISVEAWDGTECHRMKMKDDTTLDFIMTQIEHDKPLRGVDAHTKKPSIVMPRSCSYITFEEE